MSLIKPRRLSTWVAAVSVIVSLASTPSKVAENVVTGFKIVQVTSETSLVAVRVDWISCEQ